jgi:hypothetical protein
MEATIYSVLNNSENWIIGKYLGLNLNDAYSAFTSIDTEGTSAIIYAKNIELDDFDFDTTDEDFEIDDISEKELESIDFCFEDSDILEFKDIENKSLLIQNETDNAIRVIYDSLSKLLGVKVCKYFSFNGSKIRIADHTHNTRFIQDFDYSFVIFINDKTAQKFGHGNTIRFNLEENSVEGIVEEIYEILK